MPRHLPRSFYARDTQTVARDLLGRVLVRRLSDGTVLRGRIVEAEAYIGEEDKACHARAGRTPRTGVMYGPPGRAYVYFTYGMHFMLNVVTEPEGRPAAVLIRAAEPLEGIDRMVEARGTWAPHNLASGPGKLCQAFRLDRSHNGADLLGRELWIEEGEPVSRIRIATSARIGCQTAAAPWDRIPWRFYVKDSPFVTPGRSPRASRARPEAEEPARDAGVGGNSGVARPRSGN